MIDSKMSLTSRLSLKVAGIALALVALMATCVAAPVDAHASIKATDIVMGTTVEKSGLDNSDLPSIDANTAYVIDSDGTVYYSRGANKQVQIASITKVMTALVALEYGDPETTTIEISGKAAKIGESSAGLQKDDVLTLEDALAAMMINSGNDAAQAIAESMGSTVLDALKQDGSIDQSELPTNGYDAFIYAMNKKAQDLGMDESLFDNPHGLDFDEYAADMHCSAKDVYKMCAAAMQYDTFKDIVCKASDKIKVKRDGATVKVKLTSTDQLLGKGSACIGVKTGYTEKAGECFAGAWDWNGKILYTIVLGSSSETQRFSDAKTLYNWVADHNIAVPLANSTKTCKVTLNDKTYDAAPVLAEVSNRAWPDETFKATIADPEATVTVFALSGNVSMKIDYDDVSGDVRVGDKVGTVTYYQHNEVVATQDLVAAEDCPGPNFFEGIGIFFGRIGGFFSGEPDCADTTTIGTMPIIYGDTSASQQVDGTFGD